MWMEAFQSTWEWCACASEIRFWNPRRLFLASTRIRTHKERSDEQQRKSPQDQLHRVSLDRYRADQEVLWGRLRLDVCGLWAGLRQLSGRRNRRRVLQA